MPVAYDMPKCMCLTQMAEDSSMLEEVIVRVQGIFCRKELPPINNISRNEHARCRYLRQAITISGMGSEYLNKAMDNIMQIHKLFNRQHKDDQLELWQPSAYEDSYGIDASNHYFSARKDNPGSRAIPFLPMVDPKGTLTGLSSSMMNFVHTQENQVQYYEYVADTSGIKGYESTDPNKFRIGDIVEVQLLFVVVPVKENKYRLILVMHALALLDCTQSKVLNINKSTKFKLYHTSQVAHLLKLKSQSI
ncbi:hypothetical protein PILCRDRAFT_81820 [Piloderma croceum F 1598]|uniref:Uncharacterized protein n=1 Tax=Piloderma croceum (strain F 1598) TaxID=765440 RepID=A0A0C3EIM0_PILCF|nr:hypothetical protein PILCRDRAFT_81820 [Piloderma croceum F 1598]